MIYSYFYLNTSRKNWQLQSTFHSRIDAFWWTIECRLPMDLLRLPKYRYPRQDHDNNRWGKTDLRAWNLREKVLKFLHHHCCPCIFPWGAGGHLVWYSVVLLSYKGSHQDTLNRGAPPCLQSWSVAFDESLWLDFLERCTPPSILGGGVYP